MGLDDNNDIARMFGVNEKIINKPKSRVVEAQIVSEKHDLSGLNNIKITAGENSFDKLFTKDTKSQNNDLSSMDIKLTPESVSGTEDKLKNVPPLLMLGIVAIIGASFTPYKWLFTVGFCLIILAVFDKILTPEKKLILKQKLKEMFKKKKK